MTEREPSSGIAGMRACPAVACLVLLAGVIAWAEAAIAQQPDPGAATWTQHDAEPRLSSREQGQVLLDETFDWHRRQERIRDLRRQALRDIRIDFAPRTFYMDRDNFDGSENEAWAIGGALGVKTGFFRDRIAIGATGYTSQHLAGGDDRDGTLLLKAGQHGFSVLGEIYADIRLREDLSLFVGRKAFDSPYINRNDSRMVPNTFQALVLQGGVELGTDGVLSFGAGYFDKIKARNSDQFVSMSRDADASVERGVFALGGRYRRRGFEIGVIDYFSKDVINILYAEGGYTFGLPGKRSFAVRLQYSDQRSVGADSLAGEEFEARQLGVKAELGWGPALFTAAYTRAGGDTDSRSPWGGYPGYTSVQVENFNRTGEDAFLLRAAYQVPEIWRIRGLSAYALWVHGTHPDGAGRFRRDEYNVNLQWAPPDGILGGFSLRLRYAFVDQHGGGVRNAEDFRVILNYAFSFHPLARVLGP